MVCASCAAAGAAATASSRAANAAAAALRIEFQCVGLVRMRSRAVSAPLGLRDEADAADAGIGRVGHYLGDRLVLRGPVGAQVDFRLRFLPRRRGKPLTQRTPVDLLAVPVERAVGP